MEISSAASLKVIIAAITVAMLAAGVAEAPSKSSMHQIAIAYEKPKNPAHDQLRDLLVQARVLEQVQEILSPFRLPKTLPISIESCDGESDARYLYSEARIKVCYEYLHDIWKDLPPDTTASGVAPIDAIVGPLADVFFHEFGHAIFDLHKIPVLGREEYAADTVSAMLMLSVGKDEARRLIKPRIGTRTTSRRPLRSSHPNSPGSMGRRTSATSIWYASPMVQTRRCLAILSKRAFCQKSAPKTANQNFNKLSARSIS